MIRPALLVGFVFALVAGLYLHHGWTLPLGTVRVPGPGLYPLLVGGLVAVAAISLLFRSAADEGSDWPGARGLWRVGAMVLGLLAFCLVLPAVGYIIAMFGTLVLAVRMFGATGWVCTALLAGSLTAASYALFAMALGVPLDPWPGVG